MSNMKISEYVARERLNEGTSIRQFAKNHGISTNLAFRYENGDVDKPTQNAARKFCKTFNISLGVFAAEFFYEDEKIKKNFINQENVKSRLVDFFFDGSTKKLINDFYDSLKDIAGLHDIKILDVEEVKSNPYGIWHQATCYTRNNELVWICPVLYLLGDSAPVIQQNYSSITSPINYIGLIDKKDLPDECANYIFLIPNKVCFNYLRDTKYNKEIKKKIKNNVMLYFVDRKKIKEGVVLFGKDFLNQN